MSSIKITLSLLLFLPIFTHSEAKLRHLRETEMTLYYKDFAGGPNATTIPIPIHDVDTAPSTCPLNFTQFGAMFCTDDPITEGIEEGSPPIARGRGTYVVSALGGSHAQMLMSVVFIDGQYKGSTLELQGSYALLEPVTEAAVVGGTGEFRLARGYATYEVLSYDAASGYSVTRSNITVEHY